MCLKPNGKHEPFLDALKCFENGHVLIKAYKNKYGCSYRKVIKDTLLDSHAKTKEN